MLHKEILRNTLILLSDSFSVILMFLSKKFLYKQNFRNVCMAD